MHRKNDEKLSRPPWLFFFFLKREEWKCRERQADRGERKSTRQIERDITPAAHPLVSLSFTFFYSVCFLSVRLSVCLWFFFPFSFISFFSFFLFLCMTPTFFLLLFPAFFFPFLLQPFSFLLFFFFSSCISFFLLPISSFLISFCVYLSLPFFFFYFTSFLPLILPFLFSFHYSALLSLFFSFFSYLFLFFFRISGDRVRQFCSHSPFLILSLTLSPLP